MAGLVGDGRFPLGRRHRRQFHRLDEHHPIGKSENHRLVSDRVLLQEDLQRFFQHGIPLLVVRALHQAAAVFDDPAIGERRRPACPSAAALPRCGSNASLTALIPLAPISMPHADCAFAFGKPAAEFSAPRNFGKEVDLQPGKPQALQRQSAGDGHSAGILRQGGLVGALVDVASARNRAEIPAARRRAASTAAASGGRRGPIAEYPLPGSPVVCTTAFNSESSGRNLCKRRANSKSVLSASGAWPISQAKYAKSPICPRKEWNSSSRNDSGTRLTISHAFS